jgi:hypothetical protein
MIYPEVHFPMEASLRWSGAESQSDPRIAVKWHTVISFVPPPMRSATNHYGTLEGGHRTRTRMRHTPQLNWRLSPNSRGSQSHKNHKVGARLHNLIGGSQLSREPPKLRDQQGPSRALQVPKRTSSRAPQVPKSNKLLNFDFHVSPWRTQTDATDARRQDH